jgi:hypothetical protein
MGGLPVSAATGAVALALAALTAAAIALRVPAAPPDVTTFDVLEEA